MSGRRGRRPSEPVVLFSAVDVDIDSSYHSIGTQSTILTGLIYVRPNLRGYPPKVFFEPPKSLDA